MTLYIAYPDIPWRAQRAYVTAGAADSSYPARNTIYGERYQMHKITPDGSFNAIMHYDLGASVTATASYLIIARADRLRTGDTLADTALGGSANESVWTDFSHNDIEAATLYGPRSEDYISTFSASSAYRYFRFYTNGTNTTARNVSKVYFGTAFQMGEEPEFEWDLIPLESEYYAESGERDLVRHDQPVYRFTFRWRSVTDAKVKEFYDSIVRYSHRHRYFLYTTDQHQVLNNLRVLHVRLIEASTENPDKKVDWNDLTATFEEIIG